MTIEACPFCGAKFDGQKHRYTENPLLRPDSVDAMFTVRCPSCAEAYVSDTVRFLGVATRKNFYVFGLVLVVAVVVFATAVAPLIGL